MNPYILPALGEPYKVPCVHAQMSKPTFQEYVIVSSMHLGGDCDPEWMLFFVDWQCETCPMFGSKNVFIELAILQVISVENLFLFH